MGVICFRGPSWFEFQIPLRRAHKSAVLHSRNWRGSEPSTLFAIRLKRFINVTAFIIYIWIHLCIWKSTYVIATRQQAAATTLTDVDMVYWMETLMWDFRSEGQTPIYVERTLKSVAFVVTYVAQYLREPFGCVYDNLRSKIGGIMYKIKIQIFFIRLIIKSKIYLIMYD